MMDRNLGAYVKVYKDVFSKDVCRSVVGELEKQDWKLHTYFISNENRLVSYDNELSVNYANVPHKEEMMQAIWHTIKNYLEEVNTKEWFDGWNGYTSIRFNKYDEKTQMKLHCDHIHSMFDGERKGVPILTVLGALNDDYEGGEFFMWGDEQIEIPPGAIIVFPSNFLYPHEVKPVTSGTRYSYVSWVW